MEQGEWGGGTVASVTDARERFAAWVLRDTQWSRAGLLMAALAVVLTPPLARSIGFAGMVVYIQLPVYMLHQYEEHAHGAFKAYLNRLLPASRQLTDGKIFGINIVGVWGLDLLALYLALYVNLAFGLAAAYLAGVNALLHIGQAARTRQYNPGLATALLLMVPAGGYAIVAVSRAAHASVAAEALGLGAALAVHVATIAVALRKR